MTNLNAPVVNAPNKYVNGLVVSQFGTGLLGITAGAARDSTNVSDIILPTNINFLITRVGINGLDTGVATVNTNYAVHIIGDSSKTNPTAGLFSLNASAPQLPLGYDMFRRIGWFRTTAADATLLSRYFSFGDGQNRSYYIEEPITFLTAGNATAPTIINAATSGAAPSIATELLLDIAYTPAAATNNAKFVFANSAIPIERFGTGVAGLQVGALRVPTGGGAAFRYWVTAAGDSLTLMCTGFMDYLA